MGERHLDDRSDAGRSHPPCRQAARPPRPPATRADDFILILAGKGHNGDDARAAKEFLDSRRVKVLELLLPDTDLLKLEMTLREKPALVIDGIFGIGLNRPLAEPWQKIIAAVNAAKIPVLAVDIPSGLNADTGETFGAAIEAAITLTVGAPKTGMLAAPAWPFVGRLEVADDVGLVPCPHKSELNWTLPEDFHSFPPPRPVADHKGSFGHVAIIAGSLGFHGAAVLAARGAARAARPRDVDHAGKCLFRHRLAVAVRDGECVAAGPEISRSHRRGACRSGPGGARRAGKTPPRSAALVALSDCPLIVDASALDFLVTGPFVKRFIRVLTPHPGEAARLLNWPVQKIQFDRVTALREISKKFGDCWVVLKGHQTLIGRSEGEIFVNPSGNPHLAQGGSGDLLSGFIAGLLAQPALQAEVVKTLCYAVWQHGAAADKLQAARANWTVEDLANEIGSAR